MDSFRSVVHKCDCHFWGIDGNSKAVQSNQSCERPWKHCKEDKSRIASSILIRRRIEMEATMSWWSWEMSLIRSMWSIAKKRCCREVELNLERALKLIRLTFLIHYTSPFLCLSRPTVLQLYWTTASVLPGQRLQPTQLPYAWLSVAHRRPMVFELWTWRVIGFVLDSFLYFTLKQWPILRE